MWPSSPRWPPAASASYLATNRSRKRSSDAGRIARRTRRTRAARACSAARTAAPHARSATAMSVVARALPPSSPSRARRRAPSPARRAGRTPPPTAAAPQARRCAHDQPHQNVPRPAPDRHALVVQLREEEDRARSGGRRGPACAALEVGRRVELQHHREEGAVDVAVEPALAAGGVGVVLGDEQIAEAQRRRPNCAPYAANAGSARACSAARTAAPHARSATAMSVVGYLRCIEPQPCAAASAVACATSASHTAARATRGVQRSASARPRASAACVRSASGQSRASAGAAALARE